MILRAIGSVLLLSTLAGCGLNGHIKPNVTNDDLKEDAVAIISVSEKYEMMQTVSGVQLHICTKPDTLDRECVRVGSKPSAIQWNSQDPDVVGENYRKAVYALRLAPGDYVVEGIHVVASINYSLEKDFERPLEVSVGPKDKVYLGSMHTHVNADENKYGMIIFHSPVETLTNQYDADLDIAKAKYPNIDLSDVTPRMLKPN